MTAPNSGSTSVTTPPRWAFTWLGLTGRTMVMVPVLGHILSTTPDMGEYTYSICPMFMAAAKGCPAFT